MKMFKSKTIGTWLLAPLIGLLILLLVTFSYLIGSIQKEYKNTNLQIEIVSKINQSTIEITRVRARIQEVLLLYRLTQDKKYVHELEILRRERVKLLENIGNLTKTNRKWEVQTKAVVGGLSESQFLQDQMMRGVQEKNFKHADESFRQLSTILEINSARLRDMSLSLEIELQKDQRRFQDLFVRIFWIIVFVFGLVFVSILSILVFYRLQVLKPLLLLQKGFQEISEGNMNVQIPLGNYSKEIHAMGEDFNEMAMALKASQKSIIEAREDALQAARIKSDFLSNMSHEIRTPMNAIIGMADLMNDGELPPEQNRYLQILRKSSRLLLNIVNDILDYSRLELGITAIEAVAFDLQSLAARTSDIIEVLAKQKGLRYIFKFTPTHECWVKGDPKRFEQIIVNLLGNAVKFTDSGFVEFSVEVTESSQPEKQHIKIEVVDSGIGISPENRDRIFTRFSQSDKSISKIYGGTGLGLAIVKQLADNMNGKISVQSEVNQGSRFTFEIELPKAEKAVGGAATEIADESAAVNHLAIPEIEVLLVDDNPDNRLLVEIYLEKTKAHVTTAEDGQQAVKAAAQKNFDVILMDMQMPVMDGYTATAKIRENEKNENRPRSKIIALTAYALKEEVERSYKAGCDTHLTKPIKRSRLFQTIAGLV